ncbi:hypothetical protein NL676_030696 [Syzygium grande]|nr:hypothetical protein NL676_030696 [Syzygium grande]
MEERDQTTYLLCFPRSTSPIISIPYLSTALLLIVFIQSTGGEHIVILSATAALGFGLIHGDVMDIHLFDDVLEEATASNAEAMASSQLSSNHSSGMAIGYYDEFHSTMDGEQLESDPWVPRVGMEFDSEMAVYNFYCRYAKQTGFNVRRGKAEYSGSNEAVIRAKYFLCSCQGHKFKEHIAKMTPHKRRATRTGCDAKIECVVNDGTWKISKVVLEHNHATTALSTGRIADKVRAVGERALVSNVSQGKPKNCPRPAPEETQDLIDHFICLARLDCCSCYSLRMVEARGMENFFWRDSQSKLDYEHFGDLLVLDTRTRINKYGMICATFWGLNHHRQPTIFGHGLLVDQTVGSFHWLLDSFLESMNWQKPQTIITEVSQEIAEAVSLVLLETPHCLPAWSVLNSFRKCLSPLSDQTDVVNFFGECVFLQSQEEFESKWNSLIGKYKLHDNSWLASLYKMHERWCHAFTRNVFSVGLLSMQNDEDAGHIVGNLSSETMTLTEIACREEFCEDMLCEKNTVNLETRSPMEKEAERFYTRTIFKMFQRELIDSLRLAIKEIKGTETLRMFQLTEEGSRKTQTVGSRKTQTVKFDPSDSTLACNCGKFESVGILCVHALKVLNFMNIFKVPSRYLLKRWAKSAKDSLPVYTPAQGLHVMEFMRKALHVAHMSVNKKRKRIAMGFIDLALEHIAKALKTEEVAVALDDPNSKDDMDRTICEYALETQLDQENVAKSGMGCPRVKRKVEGHGPAGKRVSVFLTALPH